VEQRDSSSSGVLRVCLAAHSYIPAPGGLQRVIDDLAQNLVSRGHHVTVVTQCRRQDSFERDELRGDVRVLRFPSVLGGRRFGYAPALTVWVRRHEDDFDVIHAFNYHAPVALGIAIATSAPLIVTTAYHGGGHSRLARWVHVPYRVAANMLWRRASVVVANSHGEGLALAHDIPQISDRIRVVSLALDRAPQGLAPMDVQGSVVMFAGRLDRYKCVDILLRAVSGLDRDVTLVICGIGPERVALEALAHELKIAHIVRFTGYVDESTLWRWRLSAHVIVSLSSYESFGLSLAEGAAAGAVVVATDIPAHSEVIDHPGVISEVVPARPNTGAVIVALQRALAHPRPGSENFVARTWTDVSNEYEAIYRDVLK
jgi:glycosyltransferase involved in cell wall biosynthesis